MDEAAPITWLVGRINDIMSSGAAATAGTIASIITPVVSACFGIYVCLLLWGYMRGQERDPLGDFLYRMAAWALIIGFGFNAGSYASTVIPMVTGIGTDIATAMTGGSLTAGSLDTLALWYFKIIEDGYAAIDGFSFPASIGASMVMMSKVAIICIGLIPFLVVATMAIIIANVGAIMVAMVGPIFFAFLLFPPTRQYFSAWVNVALSYALIPIFVAVIAVMSVGLSKEMLSSGGTLYEASYKSVFLASIGNLTLLVLMHKVGALASALSAGGINVATPGGVGSFASFIRNGAMGSGREIRSMWRGGGAAYRGGQRLAQAIANRRNSLRKAG